MTTLHSAAGRSVPALPLVAAFAGAVAIRAALAGPAGAASAPAALVFAVVLTGLALACRLRTTLSLWAVVAGLAVAALLVVPALVHLGIRADLPAGNFPAWAALTAIVATAEEAFLRGALFDAVQTWVGERRHGVDVAIAVTAAAFALLHVPFYGWHALPLDLAVGVVLGATRAATGTWTAPAIAHVVADLAGWWLL